MTYGFHPEALEEYRDAALYFLRSQEGLELRFIDCVERAIHEIVVSPMRYRLIDKNVRRRRTRVFAYDVLYTIENNFILIVAVMHCHREPGYWMSRV